jgi:hypothetical protein
LGNNLSWQHFDYGIEMQDVKSWLNANIYLKWMRERGNRFYFVYKKKKKKKKMFHRLNNVVDVVGTLHLRFWGHNIH